MFKRETPYDEVTEDKTKQDKRDTVPIKFRQSLRVRGAERDKRDTVPVSGGSARP